MQQTGAVTGTKEALETNSKIKVRSNADIATIAEGKDMSE